MNRENVWAEEFKSYVAELQLFRDDYKGIIEYIDEGLAMMKEQDKEVQNAYERGLSAGRTIKW